jgi:hypothetical protein
MSAVTAEFKDLLDTETRMNELGTRIVLRLNPTDYSHIRLIQLVGEIASKGYDLNRGEYTPADEAKATSIFNQANKEFVSLLQSIQQQQWERIKKEEI